MAFTRRPVPLELGPPSTPSTVHSPTPPSSPGFKFWKKAKAAVPLPPKSPTFALSNSPLHPNAQQQQQQLAGSKPSGAAASAAGPQSILIRHDVPKSAPFASDPSPSSKSTLPPSPPPTPAGSTSAASSSASSTTCSIATSDAASFPPPPTPRRKSSSSESLSNRRSGAVFPADLLASASFRSLVSDLPPSPRLPTFPLASSSFSSSATPPPTSEFGEQVRRASDGTSMPPAVVSTRRTGGSARSGSPKSTLPAWARVEAPSTPVASGSVPASGRRFGHGRKRSNSMSNIPLMVSSPLAGSNSTSYPAARDDASFEYMPSVIRPATTLFGSRPPTSLGSPKSSPPLAQQVSTRAPPVPMRSSRPAAPAVRMANRAASAMSTPPSMTASETTSMARNPPSQERLMSGFPSFVQPQLASFRTLERLHDGAAGKHCRSDSPPPPMPTWPQTTEASAAAHPADSLPQVWVIPATPDLGGLSSSSSDTDETVDECDLGTEPDIERPLGACTLTKAEYSDDNQQTAPIALDFGFDFGASLRFGSDDSLSAILASSAAIIPGSQTEAVEQKAGDASLDDDEQVTPKLIAVALIDSPEPEPVAAPEALDNVDDTNEEDRRLSAASDFAVRVVGDGSELESELARMIASLSVDSLAASSTGLPETTLASDALLVAPEVQTDDSLRSPAASNGSATPSPGLGSASLEEFPAPPAASAPASSSVQHGHSHSVPVLSGLGLGLTLDPASSLLFRRRQAAAEQHESQHARSASAAASAMMSPTAPLVRDHRRPFYLASASTPALSFTPRAAASPSCSSHAASVAPLTPPLTAGALAVIQDSANNGSPSDCYLPRGETTDDLADLLANSRPGSPSDDDDDDAHGLAYRLAGPSDSFSAATSRSSTISSLASVQSSASVSRAASGKRSIASTTTTSSSTCASDFGDDEEGEVEIARVTETALMPVRWAFASSTSGDLLAKTPPLPPPAAPTRPLPIPVADDSNEAYAGMAL